VAIRPDVPRAGSTIATGGADMAIAWTQDLDTGIEIIDRQHRRIVDYINELECVGREHDRGVIGQVLENLVDYTASHFTFEEYLQREAGYQSAKEHKAVHDFFIKRVARYLVRFHAGEDIFVSLHSMLTTWLLHHIKRDDAAYVSCMRLDIEQIVEGRKESGWLDRTLRMIFG
jgi:hemerythrin